MGAFGCVWACVEASWNVWARLAASGTSEIIWETSNRLGTLGGIWTQLGKLAKICEHPGASCGIWEHLGISGEQLMETGSVWVHLRSGVYQVGPGSVKANSRENI